MPNWTGDDGVSDFKGSNYKPPKRSRSPRSKPRLRSEHITWLRNVMADRKERGAGHPATPDLPPLAALTGTDSKALEAIDRAWELFAYERSDRILHAIALLASSMQESTRPLARELAARQMDWGDRERYWPRVEEMIASERARNPPMQISGGYLNSQFPDET